MAKTPRLQPADPRLFRAQVVANRRLTPSMQRVTVSSAELAEFEYLGFDHWFRLFLQLPHHDELFLPAVEGRKWWQNYLDIPEERRPHCANYTVAAFRPAADRADGARIPAELDIDFVLHRSAAGELEGGAAIWADAAQPGDNMAFLDQGALYDQPDDTSEVLIVADETGLPGTAGILASLPADATGLLLQEVATRGDVRELPGPVGVERRWIVRDEAADAHATPGQAALAELLRLESLSATAYAYLVGESDLATSGRRHVRGLGLVKERIFFSGYWRQERRPQLQPA
ncbi:siderophore-interacting protein [Schumannella luteola]|uniref:NADPH-dependent ferric siderophore reductase n=1 Tax=Schumannella luteola TaxID=472059 RepID=A0A852YCM5_9MICO|nr:siderophore-interacting protein [Schumannella luteola]NYG98931.1 NADPH-dependent ferric siderophore reductase [Schumannella luteola]TPX06305.1 siderophore-interacting protein [Schumannella luteola]